MSGIVRRIDDLGRIVIPKEIRRSLKIKDGDFLDIDVENDKILLNRYSNFLDIENFLNKLLESLGEKIMKDIIIFDNYKIVSQYKRKIKNIIGKEIGTEITELMNSRKNNYNFSSVIKVDDKEINGNYLFGSIIPNGDVIGGILIYNDVNNFDENDRFVLDLLQKTLTKYIEE